MVAPSLVSAVAKKVDKLLIIDMELTMRQFIPARKRLRRVQFLHWGRPKVWLMSPTKSTEYLNDPAQQVRGRVISKSKWEALIP